MSSLRVGTVVPVPVFTGGSQVRGHARPPDRYGQTCVYTDSGVVRMSGKLGCVTECEMSCGVTSMPSFIQGLADIVMIENLENLAPRRRKVLLSLSPFPPPGESAAACAKATTFLLPSCRRLGRELPSRLAASPRLASPRPHCNPLLVSSQDPQLLPACSRPRASLIRICQGCQGNSEGQRIRFSPRLCAEYFPAP